MKKKNTLNKIFAITGTVFVWLPILAPIFFTLIALNTEGTFLFDYLMPMELFLLVLVGGALLVVAALRVHAWGKFISWGLGISAGLLVFSQGLAVVTGLASGETEPAGFWWVLILVMLAAYWLSVMATGVGGVLLTRDLFRSPGTPT